MAGAVCGCLLALAMTAATYITLSDVKGSCINCFNGVKTRLEGVFKNKISEISFDIKAKQVFILCQNKHELEIRNKLVNLGYLKDNINISQFKPVSILELDQANDQPVQKEPSVQWYSFAKSLLALIIGYTELCCVLMTVLPMHVLFIVAAVNLALITWLGWDHFKSAWSSLKYLLPPILMMLGLISAPFVLPLLTASFFTIWATITALSVISVVGIAWQIRTELSMETLITLSISMAWLFSTLQLCIPALSIAFGAQLYFQDSMIILGIIGIATQIKNSWISEKKDWLVYENNRFTYKNTASISQGHIIKIAPNKAYPFPLQLINGSINVDSSIRNDQAIKKLRLVKQSHWILPWEYTQSIDKNNSIYARVGEFRKSHALKIPGWADKIAQYFLPVMLTVACLAATLWYLLAPQAVAISYAIKAFMGVLMAACPCVLAVVAPICEVVGKNKISQETHTHFKDQVSVGHLATVNKVVFDKTGTLTKITDDQGAWPMRDGCDRQLTNSLQKLGKQVFILSGDSDKGRYEAIMDTMGLNENNVICHPVFSSNFKRRYSGDHYKTILLSWLAQAECQVFPESIIRLVKAFHAGQNNTDDMINALTALEKKTKSVNKTHVLYIDDGPGLETPKPGCLTLQCTDLKKGGVPALVADGQIENPANLPQVFQYMSHTQFYMSQQFALAMLYNMIALPLMAGAFSFWFMPAPWVGAILMNVFSIYLINRSKQLTAYLDQLVLPTFARHQETSQLKSMIDLSGRREIVSSQNTNDNKGLMPSVVPSV